jgi:hypothetical protein
MHAITEPSLTSPCLHLWCGTLGTLLADLGGVASCGRGGVLGLLSLLLRLGGGLLLLALLDGSGAGGGAGLGTLAAALLDYIERGTDDGTLVLDCAAGTLLGDFLLERRRLAQFAMRWWELCCEESNIAAGNGSIAQVWPHGRLMS